MDPIEVLLGYAVNRTGAEGILTGGHFAAQVSRCIGGGSMAETLTDEKGWIEAVKKESNVLAYTAGDLSILHSAQHGPGGTKLVHGKPNPESRKQLDDLLGEAEKLGNGDVKPLMVFECIITSTREDRDRDILESRGAEVDPVHPLLWQHIPMQPIGRHLRVTEQNDKFVKGGFAILPTALGQDAVTLIEFNALRISHGFIPVEFEPRSKTEGEDVPGWRIRKFKVLETSVVSVPSNEDAAILAYSRSKLTHPLVKRWAANLKSLLPPVVVGGWHKEAGGALPAGGITVNVNLTQGSPAGGTKEPAMDPKEEAAKKAAEEKAAKEKADADKKAAEEKAAKEKADAAKLKAEQEASKKTLKLAQKRLGKKATSKLKDAHELIGEAAKHKSCPATVRALLKEAASLVKDVYNSGEEEGKEEEEEEGKEEMEDEDKEEEEEEEEEAKEDEEEEDKEDEEEEEEKRVAKDDEEEEGKDDEEEESKEDEEEEEGKGKSKKGKKKKQKSRTPNQLAGDLLMKLFDADGGPDPAIVQQVIEQGKVYVSAAAAVE